MAQQMWSCLQGAPLSPGKEGIPTEAAARVRLLGITLSKTSQSENPCDSTPQRDPVWSDSETGGGGGDGGSQGLRDGAVGLDADGASVSQEEQSSGDGCGEGCPTMGMYLKPLGYTLNTVEMVIFYHHKKNGRTESLSCGQM